VAAEEAAGEAREAAVEELGEEVRGVAVAPEEEAIARLPGVEAELGAAQNSGAARGLAEAGEAEAAHARVPPVPVVAADFVAELPVALEAAEGLVAVREAEPVAAIDRQLCHLVGMSLGTDRAALAAPEVLGIGLVASVGQVALVGPEESEIGRAASVDQEVLQIDLVASVGRVESGTVRAALEDQEVLRIGLVASVGQVVLPIGLESIDPEPELAIDPELTIAPALEIDPVSEVPSALALGLVSEQDSRIDPELGTAHSSEIALGTAATDSAIVLISRTTAVTASKIAGIVLKTVRRTAAIGSRTVATGLKIAVIALRTGAIG